MSDAEPFKREEFLDKPGIVGARWWHEGLVHADPVGRRTALQALFVGGGLIALGVGTGFGIAAMNGWSSAQKEGCAGGNCPTGTGHADWSTARADGNASTGAFVAGSVLVAASAILWLTRPHAPAAVGFRPDGRIVVAGTFP